MARFYQVPISPVYDLGYKLPAEALLHELEYKRSKAEEADKNLTTLSEFTFKNISASQESADKVRKELASDIDRLTELYNQDPVLASRELNQTIRKWKIRANTPGRDVYTFNKEVADVEARKKIMEEDKTLLPIEKYMNFEKYMNNWKGAHVNESGNWVGISFPIYQEYPNLVEYTDNILKNIKENQNVEFDQWYDPQLNHWVVEKKSIKGTTSDKIKNALENALLTDQSIAPLLPGYIEYQKIITPNLILEEQVKELEKINNNLKMIDELLTNPGMNLSAEEIIALEKSKEQLQQKMNEIPKQTDEYALKLIIDRLVKFGTDKYQNEQIDKTRQYIEKAKDDKKDETSISGVGLNLVNVRSSSPVDLDKLKETIKETKKQIKESEFSLNQAAISFASVLGFNTLQETIAGVPVYSPNEFAKEVFLDFTREAGNILKQNLPVEVLQQTIQDKINEYRAKVGGVVLSNGLPTKEGFNFNEDYTFEDFELDHRNLSEIYNTLQLKKELLEREETKEKNIYRKAFEIKEVGKIIDYNERIDTRRTNRSNKFIEPEQNVKENMWKTYFNITPDNYQDFLINNSLDVPIYIEQLVMKSLYQLNKKLAEKKVVEPLSPNIFKYHPLLLNESEREQYNMLLGLAERIKTLKEGTKKVINESPELLSVSSEIMVPTKGYGSETEDAVKRFSQTVSLMFQDLGLLRLMNTPDGQPIEKAINAKKGMSEFSLNFVNPKDITVYPVLNPVGGKPTILIDIDNYSKSEHKKLDPDPIEVVLDFGPDGKPKEDAILDQLDIFIQTVLNSDDNSPETTKLKQAARAYLSYRVFGEKIHDSWIGAISAGKEETIPINIGTFPGTNKKVEISKNKEGLYQIYIDGEPQLKMLKERPSTIHGVHEILGDALYLNNKTLQSSVFTDEESVVAKAIADVEMDERGYLSRNEDALGKYQFIYSHHEDRIRKALQYTTNIPFYTEANKYDDEVVKESFLNNSLAQDYAMKDWIQTITPTMQKLYTIAKQYKRSFTPNQIYYIIHREGEKGAEKWLLNYITTGIDDYTNKDNNQPILKTLKKIK
ncbi:MAG: hypothetical protein KatS3mg002_1399 [Candidatus Woesearchaeota archaeon]|nr:MAG: hypothetical protein KatS3mg002_1399 [Candidatus Woesearchaeota archaeon]